MTWPEQIYTGSVSDLLLMYEESGTLDPPLSSTQEMLFTFRALPTSLRASGYWLNTRLFSSGATWRSLTMRLISPSILLIQLPTTLICTDARLACAAVLQL